MAHNKAEAMGGSCSSTVSPISTLLVLGEEEISSPGVIHSAPVLMAEKEAEAEQEVISPVRIGAVSSIGTISTLLVTSNVGSLFEKECCLMAGWIAEFAETVRQRAPQFLALHLQEVGGKEHCTNVEPIIRFVSLLSESLREYTTKTGWMDTEGADENNYTALGCLYFIRDGAPTISMYNFSSGHYAPVTADAVVTYGPPPPHCRRVKFQRGQFGVDQITRKGFTLTRWLFGERPVSLVNVHLFHDANNMIAAEKTPSEFSVKRQNALKFVFEAAVHGSAADVPMPIFFFGDFNFRLALELVCMHLSDDKQTLSAPDPAAARPQKKVLQRRDTKEEILVLEAKRFQCLDGHAFSKDNGREFLQFDLETQALGGQLHELPIRFPMSYPFCEDVTRPTEYMATRCPGWCDRVLMTDEAFALVHATPVPAYGLMGLHTCMGDHKPVFLALSIPMAT